MSPAALLELEERAQELVHLDKVRAVVTQIYALDVSSWNDDNFAALEKIIDTVVSLLSSFNVEQHRPFIQQLLEAREGIEQGVSPDPAKRPTAAEMRAFVSEHIAAR